MKEEVVIAPIRTFLGALLVGGTAIGAGMLGLPVATAEGGLIPSWVAYLICYVFSMATGLLFVEIGLWLPPKANIVTMATRILGRFGKIAAWGLYIFLFYCLTIAYVSGGGRLIKEFLGGDCPYYLAVLLFTLFFGFFVYLGTKVAGRLNGVLVGGLIIAYLGFIYLGSMKLDFSAFERFGWKAAMFGLPVIFTSFSYQGTIPSLLEYLGRSPQKMRKAIVIGTSIPFVAYVFWDLVIKGIVPVMGEHGLLAAKAAGLSAVTPLQYYISGSRVYMLGNFFAFFALTTSFIGVTLGLIDFLSDSLKLSGKKTTRFLLCSIVFIPAIAISLVNPSIFLQALGYAGGFGCALLLGLLPIVMTWVGRYKLGYSSVYTQLKGGKPVLLLLAIFVIFEVGVELFLEISRFFS